MSRADNLPLFNDVHDSSSILDGCTGKISGWRGSKPSYSCTRSAGRGKNCFGENAFYQAIVSKAFQPHKANRGHNTIVNSTYPTALVESSPHISIVSTEKVDIVVNAPSIPVPKSKVNSFEIISLANAAIQTPSKSEPTAFTTSVPCGFPIHSLTAKRSVAPIAPPNATAIYEFTKRSCRGNSIKHAQEPYQQRANYDHLVHDH